MTGEAGYSTIDKGNLSTEVADRAIPICSGRILDVHWVASAEAAEFVGGFRRQGVDLIGTARFAIAVAIQAVDRDVGDVCPAIISLGLKPAILEPEDFVRPVFDSSGLPENWLQH